MIKSRINNLNKSLTALITIIVVFLFVAGVYGGRSSSVMYSSGKFIKIQDVKILPEKALIARGTAIKLKAGSIINGRMKNNERGEYKYFSSNTLVATVNSKGLVKGINPGDAIITAINSATGQSKASVITVSSAKLVSIEVTPVSPYLAEGSLHYFKAAGKFNDNTVQDITNIVNWASSDSKVAAVSNMTGSLGYVFGVNEGNAYITAVDTETGIKGSALTNVYPRDVAGLY